MPDPDPSNGRARARVLVTGGAGFIGSNLVDRLVAEGHTVAVVDDFSSGKDENLAMSADAIEVHRMDIRSPAIAEVFASFRPEVVCHLAAQIDVRVSVADPVLDADVNVLGTLRICEEARAAGARKVVVASSGGCIYGEPSIYPIKETCRTRPASPYGISKRVLHDYLSFYGSVHGLDHTVLAMSNVYGPRQDPHGEAGVVAIFINRLLAGEETVVFGDGKQTRDFVYVADAVDAFARALHGGRRSVLNIGTGRETNVVDLLQACAAALDVEATPRFAPARPGELQRSAVDASRAARVLGWKPQTSLDAGLRETAGFLRAKR